jgi:hypothetical protein
VYRRYQQPLHWWQRADGREIQAICAFFGTLASSSIFPGRTTSPPDFANTISPSRITFLISENEGFRPSCNLPSEDCVPTLEMHFISDDFNLVSLVQEQLIRFYEFSCSKMDFDNLPIR